MKKTIPILFLLTILFFYFNKEDIIIPPSSIRFRIIANSNNEIDQELKQTIKDELTPYLNQIMSKAHNKDEALSLLNDNLSTFQSIINKYTSDSIINIGKNYFPEKEYMKIKIPEGYYESMVITLGNGLGDNFWCVMYPPMCLIDDSNSSKEYRLLIKDILNKYKS